MNKVVVNFCANTNSSLAPYDQYISIVSVTLPIVSFHFYVIWFRLGSIHMPVTRLHRAVSTHVRSQKGTQQRHPVSSPTWIANWPERLSSKNVSSCSRAQRRCGNCWYYSQGVSNKQSMEVLVEPVFRLGLCLPVLTYLLTLQYS